MSKNIRTYILFIFVSSMLIFLIGFSSYAFEIKIKLEITLSDILTLLGWIVAIVGAWQIARRQLILRHRSSAVKSMMHSNRELTQPLTQLVKIIHFEEQTPGYYAANSSKLLFDDLAALHNEVRRLLIIRTQTWEEHRISLMPTENEFLFIKYLLEDLREDLYDVLSANENIETITQGMDSQSYEHYLDSKLRFSHLGGICMIIIVLSLDYGNLLQNKYLSGLFNTSIPNRTPLDGSPILEDYDSRKLTSTYQIERDKYFAKSLENMPRFYNHIGVYG